MLASCRRKFKTFAGMFYIAQFKQKLIKVNICTP